MKLIIFIVTSIYKVFFFFLLAQSFGVKIKILNWSNISVCTRANSSPHLQNGTKIKWRERDITANELMVNGLSFFLL